MTSGNALKYQNGFLIEGRYETRLTSSSQFLLTLPVRALSRMCIEVHERMKMRCDIADVGRIWTFEHGYLLTAKFHIFTLAPAGS